MMEFLLYPVLAGLLVALLGGPLGSFVIWQRMAYVGESIAHSALLGVALGIWFDLNITAMVILVCCCLALLLNHIQKFLRLSLNTVLAIMAHTSLAAGLVIISLVPNFRLDINSFLFGDLLSIDQQDLIIMACMVSALMVFLLMFWRKLVSLAANEELASVEGINTQALQLSLNLALALLVAVGIKMVGVLLIVSLLIIPAATCRKWVTSPEGMAILASVVGASCVLAGLAISYAADTPAGPTIVALSGGVYFLSQLLLKIKA
jgi:zinc transport system permease protein